MNILVLTEYDAFKIQSLVEYANKHPYTLDDLLDTLNGTLPAVGDREGYSAFLSNGYKIVLSIEQQPKFNIRHLSISDSNGQVPDVSIVNFFMEMTGFKHPIHETHNYIEKCETYNAINIIEKIN